jgi:hypothetical protein
MFYTLLTEAEIGLLRALVGDYQRRMILDMRETGLTALRTGSDSG